MAWHGRPGRESSWCSYLGSALLSPNPSQRQSWWPGLDIGHKPCAVPVKCSVFWFHEAQGVPVLGPLRQNSYRSKDVESGCSWAGPRAKIGSLDLRSIRKLVSKCKVWNSSTPLICRAMDWAGEVKGISPVQGKFVTKYDLQIYNAPHPVLCWQGISPSFFVFPWVEIPCLKARMGSDLSFTACQNKPPDPNNPTFSHVHILMLRPESTCIC